MLRFAWNNLSSRPLRSLLSVLGLAVAIGGMIGLFSIAGGIDRMVAQTFDQIPGLVVQQQGAPLPLFSSLPAAWQTELEAIPGVGVVDPEVVCRVNQLDGRAVINPPRLAVGMSVSARERLKRSVYRDNLLEGRYFRADDDQQFRCLLSREVAESIGKQAGDRVRINGFDFEIIGIFHTGSLLLDVNILMDIHVCRQIGRIDPRTVGCFYVEQDGSTDDATLKQRILEQFRGRSIGMGNSGDSEAANRALALAAGFTSPSATIADENPLGVLFRSLHQQLQSATTESVLTEDVQQADVQQEIEESDLRERTAIAADVAAEPGRVENGESPIEVRSAEDWGARIAEFSGDLQLFLGLMTAIGVSIATMSIVNTMLMSVTERTTEFGILRANGWSKGNIVRLMTLESSLIGFWGGVLGVIGGWGATWAANVIWADRLRLYASMELLLFGVLFSCLLGILGGLYPAWRAASFTPMESIRRG